MLTKKQLRKLWEEYSFRPNKRYGQNFLIDTNVKDKIINFINPICGDSILEIGAGFGELTIDLARGASNVTAIEKDKRISRILKESLLKDIENLDLVECDFLEYALLKKFNKIAGNLPYYIATPIIEKLLSAKGKAESIFIMVQREYAERILAKPGRKDYSSLSCFVQFQAKIKRLITVKKECFFPEPKVDSIFLEMKPLKKPEIYVRDEKFFFRIIRSSFQQRRKTLRSSLSGQGITALAKSRISDILEDIGINRNARPEDISLEDFARLSDALL